MTWLAAFEPGRDLSVWALLWHYRWVFIAALAVSWVATPLMRRMALRHNIVDHPDQKRKHHRAPIPYLGGVAMFLGWTAGIFACLYITPHYYDPIQAPVAHVSFPMSILMGAMIIVIVGLFDDIYGVSPRVKVGGQLLAAAALALQDVGQRLAFELFRAMDWMPPSWLTYLLGAFIITVFVIGGCNAVNLLDGLDGLATGVTAISCLGFLFLAMSVALQQFDAVENGPRDVFTDPVRIVMCLALLGALLGFLPHNFNPAKIFMGDTGSLLLGYLSVATILLFAHLAESGPRLVVAALIVFGLPITDTLLAIVRRKVHGVGIMSPDSQHLHHKLIRMGLSVKQAVGVMYLASLGFAIVGCLLTLPSVRLRHALILLFIWLLVTTAIGVVMGIRRRRMLKNEPQATLDTPRTDTEAGDGAANPPNDPDSPPEVRRVAAAP